MLPSNVFHSLISYYRVETDDDELNRYREERRGHRGSVLVNSKDQADFTGYGGSYSPKKNGHSEEIASLNLTISKLEKQIELLDEKRGSLEQMLYDQKVEARELKDAMQEQTKDSNAKIRELQVKLDTFQREREGDQKKVQERIRELEIEKAEYLEKEKERLSKEIEDIKEQERQSREKLEEHIKELEKENTKKFDDFLALGVEIDKVKEELVISRENEVKLKNNNDCLKEMNNIMQGILQKHEAENKLLAEQLLAFKQQIIESDTFNYENQKFEGFRYSSFGKSPALLYFTEESIGDNKTDLTYSLIMEYGSGRAIKVNVSKLEDFYINEGTNQI